MKARDSCHPSRGDGRTEMHMFRAFPVHVVNMCTRSIVNGMAGGEGFEPSGPFQVRRVSSAVVSAGSPTRPQPHPRNIRPLGRSGGATGIRTLETLPSTHFPGVRLRPLGHLSASPDLRWNRPERPTLERATRAGAIYLSRARAQGITSLRSQLFSARPLPTLQQSPLSWQKPRACGV